ncbi:DNA topoisomerase IV [Nonlabens dokdonensis]|uniref:DNA topoisomerase IV n=1 Tax=Nonlabens dokdonensis TaxID=328515 RepID=A0A1Z8AMD5_9FLAO|nr:DNA topoisomerase IV [Nonlabens dokdonensis]OUS11338.1 DNA topoisomerase IV [Nonlabens dokdonensis]
MKSASLLFILILLCSSCYENKRDCLDFQEGTFIWEQESGGKLLRTEFTRTKDLQIERFENKVDTSRIEWINDCEWRVIPIDPETNAESRAYLFKILSTDKNSYSFEFTQSGRDQIYKGTATIK